MKFIRDLLKYRKGALVLYAYDLISWRIRYATNVGRNDIISRYTGPTKYLIQNYSFSEPKHIANCENFMGDLSKLMMVLFHETSLDANEQKRSRVHNLFASSDKIQTLMRNAATKN